MLKIGFDLSKDKKIVFIKSPVIDKYNTKIGITTTVFGDARTKSLMSTNKSKLVSLKQFTGASHAILMKPKHADNIIVCDHYSVDNRPFECDSILYLKDGSKITTLLGMPLGDCPGIFILSPEFSGVVHSGRRSTLLNIISKTIKTLRHFKVSPVKISAFIWPGICPECYTVGQEFKDHRNYHNGRLNLAREIKDQLIESGILEWNVYTTENLFTCCSKPNGIPMFFSYRRKEKERVQAFMVI